MHDPTQVDRKGESNLAFLSTPSISLIAAFIMPSSSKHQRGGSESEGAESSSVKAAKKIKTNLHADPTQSNSPSHATFWDLPTELRTTILDLASQKPNSAAYGGSRLRLDRKTIHSLTLVSRQFHSTFNPVLYSHVKLTKPSILAEFRQSLFEKPSLGGMVKSLHLGPLSEMREGWWPVRFKNPSRESGLDDTINLLKTSLTNRDEKRRPRWCKPGKEWAYDMPARTCYASAVGRAIRAALEGVGLKLLDPDYGEVDFADAKGSSLGIVSHDVFAVPTMFSKEKLTSTLLHRYAEQMDRPCV